MISEKINVRSDILKTFSNCAYSTKYEKGALYFAERIKEGFDNDILIIDLRDIIFNHYFSKCFGEIFKLSLNSKSKVDIIFQIEPFQLPELLLGLIDFLELPYSEEKDGKIEDYFKQKNLYFKLLLEENSITFFASIDEKTLKVLDFINKNLESDFDKLLNSKLNIPSVELYPILMELLEKRFVYQNETNKRYLSAYNYIVK